jgi:hypothetical protein
MMRKVAAKEKSAPRAQTLMTVPSGLKSNLRSEDGFSDGYRNAVKLDALKEKLEAETDEKERRRINAEIRRLNNKITPAVKRAALAREPTLIPLVLQYFRETEGDTNISRCIKWVRARGAGRSMLDAAMRARIKKVFGIEGRRGRPLRS